MEIKIRIEIPDEIIDRMFGSTNLRVDYAAAGMCKCDTPEVETAPEPAAEPGPPTEEEKPKKRRTRRKKAEPVAEPEPTPEVEEAPEVAAEALRAVMNEKAGKSPETRAKVIAIAKEYHPQGKIAEVDASKYAEILERVQNV